MRSSWRQFLFLSFLAIYNPGIVVRAQHGTVGRPCEVSTDCGSGNYCAGNKRCACLTTYVEIDSYCWRSKSLRGEGEHCGSYSNQI